MVIMSVSLDDAVAKVIAEKAAAAGVSADRWIADAMRQLIDEEHYLAAIDEGLSDIDARQTRSADEVFPEILAKLELMRPR